MNDARQKDAPELILIHQGILQCVPNAEGHCVTCSDEALAAIVLSVDSESGVALVSVQEVMEEIDITLVDAVVPGDSVLVHGGVAIALLTKSEASHDE